MFYVIVLLTVSTIYLNLFKSVSINNKINFTHSFMVVQIFYGNILLQPRMGRKI